MSPCSIFHNLTWKFSAFYKFSEKKNMSVIFSLNSCYRHPASLLQAFRKSENVSVFPSRDKIDTEIYFGNSPKIGIRFFRLNCI